MPTTSEYNQFRRLIGDFEGEEIDDDIIDSYLDDAVSELTANFTPSPVVDFDVLVAQYKPEIIVWAARNYWWNKAAEYSSRHSQSVGQATQNVSEKWDRAMEMIRRLEEYFSTIQTLGTHITIGEFSRFSKQTLTRLGGRREEDILDG